MPWQRIGTDNLLSLPRRPWHEQKPPTALSGLEQGAFVRTACSTQRTVLNKGEEPLQKWLKDDLRKIYVSTAKANEALELNGLEHREPRACLVASTSMMFGC